MSCLHKKKWALSDSERLRLRCTLDAVIAWQFGLDLNDIEYLLAACDHQDPAESGLNPKGFWRVDKDKAPELRHTVLALVAFHDLQKKIRECGGDREKGIEAFLNQNGGEGWMLPETLRLADYGLGHDGRAKEHQPIASRLGPRFYDWQLAQSPEESWRECHLHARNLLGEVGYLNLLGELLRDTSEGGWREALAFTCELSKKENLLLAFEKENLLRVFEVALGSLPSASWPRRLDEARAITAERGFKLGHADLIQLLFEVLKRVPQAERPEALKMSRELLGDDGHRVVIRRLVAKELHNPSGPWHLLAREQLGEDDYRALITALEGVSHGKAAEPVAPYGASGARMTQKRLFD